MRQAIAVAEELIEALTAEQAKYDNVEDGQTIEPLAKEYIDELEARKNQLVQQAGGQ